MCTYRFWNARAIRSSASSKYMTSRDCCRAVSPVIAGSSLAWPQLRPLSLSPHPSISAEGSTLHTEGTHHRNYTVRTVEPSAEALRE